MQYGNVGKTDLRVSEIGFGCGNNAVLMVRASYEEQVAAVRRALDLGINYFDTAFAYGLGKSEENLGRTLKDLGVSPVVSTKIRIEEEGLSNLKAATIAVVEAGLKRLQRDRVDLIQLHTRITNGRNTGRRFSLAPRDVLGGVLEGFKDMRARGKVRYFGFSGLGDPKALHEVVDSGEFQSFQAYFNMLQPSAGHRVPQGFSALDYGQIIDHAAAKGMGAAVIRVLASGALTDSPPDQGGSSGQTMSPGSDFPSDLKRAELVKSALGGEIASLAQAAIRFGLMKPEVSTVLVGFSNVSHVDEAAACSGGGGLSQKAMAALQKLWDSDFGRLNL
ncbi:MAG: aldo/keto reductase [Candidatus Binatia bacterium]